MANWISSRGIRRTIRGGGIHKYFIFIFLFLFLFIYERVKSLSWWNVDETSLYKSCQHFINFASIQPMPNFHTRIHILILIFLFSHHYWYFNFLGIIFINKGVENMLTVGICRHISLLGIQGGWKVNLYSVSFIVRRRKTYKS